MLSDKETEVLRSLIAHDRYEPGSYARPMDVGGSDGSHHSSTLKRLAKNGFVERMRRNSICNLINSARGSYCYRIAEAGRVALALAKGETK